MRVLLITQGTYPFHFGGISTWCRNLITGLPGIDFHILALVANPDLAPIFGPPANVRALTTLPVWGVGDARELRDSLGLPDLRRARGAPDERILTEGLGGPLREVVAALLSASADPFALADHINALYEFFLAWDFGVSMRSATAWHAVREGAQARFPVAARAAGYGEAPLGAADVLTGLHWLSHWLLPLSWPVPDVDVAHATMAGECILPGIAAKLHHDAGLVFSEHGVHLRETYLREARDTGSLFLKLLKIGFATRTSEMAHAVSDQVSTCCDYNHRWEPPSRTSRVRTIHYGLNPIHVNGARPNGSRDPVITWLGRIDPLKDIETLLRAAAVVHRERERAVFRLYGAAPPDRVGYRDEMLALRRDLGLEEVVELPGYRSDPHAAYAEADIVVLTSISEGFPYATLEAMGAGKAVVATAVGGLPEQLGDCGVLIEPQNPGQLAAALIALIDDPSARALLGVSARERVRAAFSLEQKNRLHLDAYAAALSGQRSDAVPAADRLRADDAITLDEAAGGLAEKLSAEVPHPVDAREIAAMLEARGMTDAAARARHGASDTFALAAATFSHLRRRNGRTALRSHVLHHPERARRLIPRGADGLLLLIPVAVLVVVGLWTRDIGAWTSQTSGALLLGMAVSALLGNAFRCAVMRRGTLLIGCARWSAARRFLVRWSCVAMALLVGADLAVVLMGVALTHATAAELATFGLSSAALGGFWILGSGLALAGRAHEVGLAALEAVVVAVAAYLATGTGSSAHVEIALVAGYLAAVASAASRVRGALGASRRRGRELPRLPRLPFQLREAAPFASYGCLLIVLLLGANLVAALMAISGGTSEECSIAIGMTLALAPSIVATPAAEHAADRLSHNLRTVLSEASIAEIETAGVGERLRGLDRQQSLRYAAVVALISAIAAPAIWLLADAGAFAGLVVASAGALLLAYGLSALAYLLLAAAQLDLAPLITLGGHELALRCVLAGTAAMVLVASITFALGFADAGPVSLLCGSSVSALLASRARKRFLAHARHELVGVM